MRCLAARAFAIMSISRSRFLRGTLACAVLCAVSVTARAGESYPNGTIRFVVPATPGGTTDVLARVVAQHITQSWGVPVVVDNRAGAGGVIGASYVISSKPDGQTVLVAPSAFGVRSALDRKLPYDPLKDLAGVALMARSPSFLEIGRASCRERVL